MSYTAMVKECKEFSYCIIFKHFVSLIDILSIKGVYVGLLA